MSNEELNILQWGVSLAERKAWVFHPQSYVIGPVEEFFNGEDKVYRSPVNDTLVKGPVVRLFNGHALLLKRETLIELSDREVLFYTNVVENLSIHIRQIVSRAKDRNIPPETGVVLMVSALRMQTAALSKALGPNEETFG